VEFCSGDLAQFVNGRLRPAFRSIWFVGGGVVSGECLRLGLADEVRYSILPILIGDGIPFFEKYIFPNAGLPSAAQIAAAAEGLFVMEDWHGFGQDYDRTLMAWHDNVERRWPEIAGRYSERFRRMWKYYLLTCAGSFRARRVSSSR